MENVYDEHEQDPVAPAEVEYSTEQGVQHINDDIEAEMDTRESASSLAAPDDEQPPPPPQVAPAAAAADEGVIVTGTDSEAGTDLDADVIAAIAEHGVKRSELTRIHDVISKLLFNRGKVPPKPRHPIHVTAGELPIDVDSTERIQHDDAAGLIGIKPDELLDFAVRQERSASGRLFGPRYLRYVTTAGRKGAVDITGRNAPKQTAGV